MTTDRSKLGAEIDPADEATVRELYAALLRSWNERDGDAFAALFADDGEAIGFDGSVHGGRAEIARDMGAIFRHHQTPRYVSKVRSVRLLAPGAALLRGVAGLVPPGANDVRGELNAQQTLAAVERDGVWRIALFQNTPAALHGRPELAESLTAELREVLREQDASS